MTEIPKEFLLSNKDIENETWLDTTKSGWYTNHYCMLNLEKGV